VTKSILVIQGHPDQESFNEALMDSYVQGARSVGHEVRILAVRDLSFELVAHHYAKERELEPDLRQAQELMSWGKHWVLFYPIWWGGMPALLKGFLDRVLTADFALRYQENGVPLGLLKGRTCEIYNTSDTPPIAQWWYLQGNKAQLKRNILGLCGVKIKRHQTFGPLFNSTLEKRQDWLQQMVGRGRVV